MSRHISDHVWQLAVGPCKGRRDKLADHCARCGTFRLKEDGKRVYLRAANAAEIRKEPWRRDRQTFVRIGTVAPTCAGAPKGWNENNRPRGPRRPQIFTGLGRRP